MIANKKKTFKHSLPKEAISEFDLKELQDSRHPQCDDHPFLIDTPNGGKNLVDFLFNQEASLEMGRKLSINDLGSIWCTIDSKSLEGVEVGRKIPKDQQPISEIVIIYFKGTRIHKVIDRNNELDEEYLRDCFTVASDLYLIPDSGTDCCKRNCSRRIVFIRDKV